MISFVTRTVEVTQEDLSEGYPTCPHRCAVALAVDRVVHAHQVEVDGRWIHLQLASSGWMFRMDKDTKMKVFAFDVHFPLAPFNFQLTLPVHWWR